jgi:hypothetical protein
MYQLTASPAAVRKGQMFIPADPLNRDYAEYLDWLAAGNTPDPYTPPPAPIPQSVTRFQAKAALHQAGLLPTIEAYMAAQTTPVLVRLAWVDAQEFQRASGLLVDAAKALGLTNAELDQLFVAASEIRA